VALYYYDADDSGDYTPGVDPILSSRPNIGFAFLVVVGE
jgi:hypothetical protein